MKSSEVSDTGKKSALNSDLKNTLVMVAVAVVSVLSAFIFVTRFYSSKDVDDLTNVDEVSTVNDTDNMQANDIEVNPDKKEEVEKVESESIKKSEKKSEKKSKKSDTGNGEESNGILGKILVPMDSIVVNLGEIDSKKYLRVLISLEVGNSDTEKTIKKNKVILRDKLLSFLSTKNPKDIGTQDSQLGLRTEIKNMLNNEIFGSDGVIKQVYFSDFIVQ